MVMCPRNLSTRRRNIGFVRHRRTATSLAIYLSCALLLTGCAAVSRGRVPLVGFLALGTEGQSGDVEPFRQGLHEQGYVEGQNIIVDYRFADGKVDPLPTLAAEHVSRRVDMIVATSSPAISAAMQATRAIPIVMGISANPVEQGFVESLARPGGNVTGLTSLSLELSRKRPEILKDAVPGLARVAVLWNPNNPAKILELQETQAAADLLGFQLYPFEVRSAADVDGALAAAAAESVNALLVLGD